MFKRISGIIQKIIFTVLTLLLISTLFEVSFKPRTASAETSGDFMYSISEGEAIVTRYLGSELDVIIPSELDGYPVTTIWGDVFAEERNITNVKIPDTVEIIENNAFRFCTLLTNINLPDSILEIGSCAFEGCSGLESFSVPSNITIISERTFVGCSSLQNVTLPYGLITIETASFAECGKLEEILIPATVKSIGDLAFAGCEKLGYTIIPGNVDSIGEEAFYRCLSATFEIENGVKTIGKEAFRACQSIHTITIPASVTSIGYMAFEIPYLESIEVDSSNGFYSSQDGVLFNKSKTILIYYPMRRTGESYTIPDGVEEIYAGAFSYCYNLRNIAFPSSIEIIGDEAFFGTKFVVVNIPKSVNKIGIGAFASCHQLTEISVDELNTYYLDEDGILFNKEYTELIQYPAGKVGDEYEIPDGIIKICERAFYSCYDYLQKTIVPNSVTCIENEAFKFCTLLSDINLPNSITEIGAGAFDTCTSLAEINIPEGITQIEEHTFSSCFNLEHVVLPSTMTDICFEAFALCKVLESIKIPENINNLEGSAFIQCENLEAAFFMGDAPAMGKYVFNGCDDNFVVYYPSGSIGYTNPWNGYPTEEYFPEEFIYSTNYQIDRSGGFITGIEVNTTVAKVKEELENNSENIVIIDKNGVEYYGDSIATGMSVNLIVNSTKKESLIIVVTGDANGDGKISITDYTLARLDILGLKDLEGEFIVASDINKDGSISITDYTLIRLDILGLKKIN